MRLIDADALIKTLNEEKIPYNSDINYFISSAPTIDAVSVIRCKDCKHNQLPPTRGNAMCELWYGMTDVYGYCHYGERRKDAETD